MQLLRIKKLNKEVFTSSLNSNCIKLLKKKSKFKGQLELKKYVKNI